MKKLFEQFETELRAMIYEIIVDVLKDHQIQQVMPAAKYLNTNDAAAFLSKSPNALRLMIFQKKIASIKKGSKHYFLESDLVKWLESGRQKTDVEIAKDCEDILVIRKRKAKEYDSRTGS